LSLCTDRHPKDADSDNEHAQLVNHLVLSDSSVQKGFG